MMGVHRAVIAYARRRMAQRVAAPRLAREVETRIDDAVALLERGFGRYAVKRKG